MVLINQFDVMIKELNLTLNVELDLLQKKGKYLKSIQIKRVGDNFVISFWHGKRFNHKAIVRRTKK